MAFTSGPSTGKKDKPKNIYDLQNKNKEGLTFGNTLNKVVTQPTAPLNINNQTIPNVPNVSNTTTNIGFNQPGVTQNPNLSPTSQLKGPSSGVRTTTKNNPVDIPAGFSTSQSSSFSAPQGVAAQGVTDSGVTSGRLSNGDWDPNYVPGSEGEAFSSGVDAYTRRKWLDNFYKANGIDLKADPAASFDDEAKEFLSEQDQQKSLLDFQIYRETSKAQKQADSQKAGTSTALTSSREGVVSVGNEMARDVINQETQGAVNGFKMDLEQKRSDLTKLQQAQSREFLAGREDQIRAQQAAVAESEAGLLEQENKIQERQDKQREFSMSMLTLLSENGALANLDPESLQFLESGMEGLPPGIVEALGMSATRASLGEQAQQQFDNQVSALSSMSSLAQNGIAMTPDMMMSYSSSTGLPVESIMQFNDLAASVMADKSLDTTQQMQEIQKATYELQREQRGIITEAAKTQDYFQNQVLAINSNPNLSPDQKQAQIGNLAANLKIDDLRNPLTQTQRALDKTNIDMNLAKLNGQPLGAEEWANYGATWSQGIDYGLEPSAIIPAGSKYGVQNNTDGITIGVSEGANAGQCGRFVNDCFGTPSLIKDTYEQKMSLTDPSITMPTAGMAFVMKTAEKWGHIGMIESVDYEQGLMNIVDSNWDLDQKVQRRTIPISTASGFIRPPNGKPVNKGSGAQVAGMTDSEILTAYEKSGKVFTTPAEQTKAINAARQSGFVPGGANAESDAAKQYKKEKTQIAISTIDEAMAAANWRNTGSLGVAGMWVPMSESYNLNAQLDTIKSNVLANELAALKAASANGSSGLGALSDREGALIQAAMGKLDIGLGEVVLKKNLQAIKDSMVRWTDAIEQEKSMGIEPDPAAIGLGGNPAGLDVFNKQ